MRRCFQLFACPLVLAASHALASTLLVTESGTFSASTPVTAYSAPGDTFAYSFNLSSTPTVSNVSVGNYFNAAFSNFTYTLNGMTTSPAVGSVTLFNGPNDAGLFDICFNTACNGAIIPSQGFQLSGAQIYSGSEANPTILAGSYTPQGAYFANLGTYVGLSTASPVVIGATPEPASIALLGTGLLAAASGLMRRRRA